MHPSPLSFYCFRTRRTLIPFQINTNIHKSIDFKFLAHNTCKLEIKKQKFSSKILTIFNNLFQMLSYADEVGIIVR